MLLMFGILCITEFVGVNIWRSKSLSDNWLDNLFSESGYVLKWCEHCK